MIKRIGVTAYTPEMGDVKPLADIEAKLGYGGKWRLTTALRLTGRGIRLHERRDGVFIYYATDAAFKKLEQRYAISLESLLD